MGDSRHSSSRRASSVHREDLEATAPNFLDRTGSQEFSVVESVAVQEVSTEDETPDVAPTTWSRSVRYLVLLCAFLTSLSFGVTQVPLLYVFRLMTCDAYYKDHPSGLLHGVERSPTAGTWTSILSAAMVPSGYSTRLNTGDGTDRCSIHPIESATALSVSLLGASTTVFGTLNLFLTGTLIKRIGVKPTLLTQVFFPALRLIIQIVGVEVWGTTGIIIIQCSQIVTIVGGPSGYMLALNTFITDVVEHEGRTAALGRLTGSMMFGSALGFLLGGVVAEAFDIKAPFRLTLMLFLTSSAYVFAFLPHIPPQPKDIDADPTKARKTKMTSAFTKFFGPLMVFAPRKFITRDGIVRTEYGAFLLAWGVFLGILATGYLPTLLQLYSTDVFDFGTQQNGGLIFMYSMLRGVFLTFAFPKFIALGRRWTMKREQQDLADTQESRSSERAPLLRDTRQQAGNGTHSPKDKETPKEQTFAFDLTYTRFSLVADGLLTLLCSFVREGWQMYLVAVVLPFAAGTGSAAKGTVLQMVGSSATSSERTDALAGVSLVENMARLSTTFVFGVIFAAFASIGRTELVFTCNAAVALIGFGVLLLWDFLEHRISERNRTRYREFPLPRSEERAYSPSDVSIIVPTVDTDPAFSDSLGVLLRNEPLEIIIITTEEEADRVRALIHAASVDANMGQTELRILTVSKANKRDQLLRGINENWKDLSPYPTVDGPLEKLDIRKRKANADLERRQGKSPKRRAPPDPVTPEKAPPVNAPSAVVPKTLNDPESTSSESDTESDEEEDEEEDDEDDAMEDVVVEARKKAPRTKATAEDKDPKPTTPKSSKKAKGSTQADIESQKETASTEDPPVVASDDETAPPDDAEGDADDEGEEEATEEAKGKKTKSGKAQEDIGLVGGPIT
ncbi:hypothetical protein Z517_02056 [Fonsecaea pedrosoi CBS 271.37]|uniref:Uncharacterized protein n=1 Tax=Fonsecaea pedrosoi CBS 271.37 TaxID=1442368 RepID=A0A0D2GPB4_9EURO|nr:uncharacterized protein Z517_02056 [Fonsecaea pedrosoi CBS 271.37]KIW82813.1 hypothetical protein Z517_02056 [Fonsecaea pedrosoi CBS 271.37]